jgi:hypothetical protein
MKKTFIILIFLLIVLTGTWFGLKFLISDEETIICDQDAKLCIDGSYVGRIGPNCEFAECSSNNNNLSFNFTNDYVGEAIINYLLTQEHFSWKTRDDSHNFCAVENLDPENELFPLYIWAYCGEYIIQDNELKTLSGSSGPVKINYPNEMSFYDLGRFSHEAPGDGSYYTEDIKKIFPKNIWQQIFNFDRKNVIKRIEKIALDWLNSDQWSGIDTWESIKQSLIRCEVEKVWQTHDRIVTVKLKNGEELSTTEPELDDIIDLAIIAEEKCGKILMGTE